MRITLQPAYILHRRSYRETSLLLDVLTEEYGRIGLVARGVRQSRSTMRSLLQPFIPLFISFQGKSDLMTLTSVEAQATPLPLQGNCLLSGFYLNELLVRVLQRNDPHPKLYTIYHQTLIELQGKQLDQKVLRLFEKKLLTELGYAIPLVQDLAGETFSAEQFYQYVPEQGFITCSEASHKGSSYIFSGKSLLAFANENFIDEETLRDAKRLIRLLLTSLLDIQQMNSRQLFIK